MSLSRMVGGNLASLTVASAALAVSLYILYGPAQRGRKRRDVRGLINTGNSCFVNAILQALASCPSLYYWLQKFSRRGEENNLRCSLYKVVAVLNNLESDHYPDPYNPALLLHALRAHGWVINRDEQDAHEMLNVIMTTLEEEISSRNANSKPTHASLLDLSSIGLSDDAHDNDSHDDDGGDNDDDEDGGLMPSQCQARRPFVRGLSLPPTSPRGARFGGSVSDYNGEEEVGGEEGRGVRQRVTLSMSRDTSPKSRGRHRRSSSGVFSKFGEHGVNTVDSLTAGKPDLSPFTGMLTSKLSYSSGKSRSPVKYSSFNNITLNLPSQGFGYVTLESLLQIFISQESVESGGDDNFIKQLTFGKLPECLCFHIQRTGFTGGQPFKRHEFVEFPGLLSMNKYVYSQQLIKQHSIANIMEGGFSGPRSLGGVGQDNLYSLRSVIVHTGGISSGHYITYRKGPLGSKTGNKWYYTSDSLVKQVSYSEVSRSCAYMLFYQRDDSL